MATDVLILGGVTFLDWKAPDKLSLGGAQAMAVHKLIGGSRVVDTLGPDDADITWNGQFFGDDSLATALALDQMRIAGQPQTFYGMGQAYLVVVKDFKYTAVRFPQYFEYSISCTVVQDFSIGSLIGGAISVGSLVISDLSAAAALFGG